ncbi:glutamate--cysteine ligase [Gilvimarinus algae]|uniref:Glutamate--cysteine ligase n=1 Tax=Gilvimarinus algae TaxID=3058037 RepID=A0ABT8TBF7_9GAMM|nr:glutamate--cysteine ligase [Gilvimarinus sp. SDUM040014]MDO3381440.1 glutamate--cysteine ligase [Gilvimarinus sp. SDUM040014]
MSQFDAHLAAFAAPAANGTLRGILRGIEKESLRVTPEGRLAQTDHPAGLGSALAHPHITTDYSEALLEFITEPSASIEAVLGQLDDIHRYTYGQLESEHLWPGSMPCVLAGDDSIPVARYGSSNSGAMKTIYRLGLGHRYGRAMQTIAGVHYNFSLPDEFWHELARLEGTEQNLQSFKTDKYFALIRNFRRYFWLLLYLFGAAPAVCRSFVRGRKHALEPLGQDENTLHAPYATSLRMGDLGYQSDAQQSLIVCYNNLDNYLQTLCGAITRPHPAYEAIGLKDAEGHYQQLNTSLLQIENEFYSTIRPKRTAKSGETALQALRLRGVEYVEVRCVDLNPFEPLGVCSEQLHYLDAFLLFCLLQDSPLTGDTEYLGLQENQKRVVYSGRDPALKLMVNGGEVSAREWASQVQQGVLSCARLLDTACGGSAYEQAHAEAQRKLAGEASTPADRVLQVLRDKQQTYYAFAMELAQAHSAHFAGRPLEAEREAHFKALAEQSIRQQTEVEAADQLSFDAHLAAYYAQYRDCANCGCEPQAAISAQSGC